MQARLIPDIEQIRYYAEGALNGFETLDIGTAAECAKSELSALLRYLAAFDGASSTVPIFIPNSEASDNVSDDDTEAYDATNTLASSYVSSSATYSAFKSIA